MSELAAKVIEQVMALSPNDRTAVRRALRDQRLAELGDEDARVLQERSDSVHNGGAVLIDAEESVRRIRAKLERARAAT